MSLLSTLRRWPIDAQQYARHNAMIALTECTQRRAEREDVERFLAERGAARTGHAPEQTAPRHDTAVPLRA